MANSSLQRSRTAGSTKTKFTVSMWVKRSANNAKYLMVNYTDDSNRGLIQFGGSNEFLFQSRYSNSVNASIQTNRKFRDTSGWYHFVLIGDSTLATAADRLKLYVNGVRETSFASETQISQNGNFYLNEATTNGFRVGEKGDGSDFFDGYISHFVFLDGVAAAYTDFGQTDSTSGIWKFKVPSGLTFGTNGVHLKFENSGNLGLDSSGNTNNMSVNGNLKQALDTPSNTYCTMNPLDNYYPASTFTTGNNSIGTAGSRRSYNTGTLGVSSGKWYWEVKAVSSVTASNGCWIGIASTNATNDGVSSQQTLGYKQYDYGFSSSTGNINTNNSQSSYGSGYGDNDIVGVAMDLDNNKLYFHVNGTYENSGVPTSGSTGTGSVSIQAPSGTLNGVYTPGLGDWWTSGFNVAFNFGNGFFGTTAITSAGSNGNGSLFEYDVPNGYYALNTKNINTYG